MTLSQPATQTASGEAAPQIDDEICTEKWRPTDIGDHAMLSDGRTGALVCRDGTIDWLCMPRFDSEPCFASLLGSGQNGGWWLRPRDPVLDTVRRYRGDTMILETEYETETGAVRVTDFMPASRGEAPDIVRIVEGLRGTVCMVNRLSLRFAEGRIHPLMAFEDGAMRGTAVAGPNAVALDFSRPIHVDHGGQECDFAISAGERDQFILTWYPSYEDRPKAVDSDKALEETERFWAEWSSKSKYEGDHKAVVMRSLLTLKGLILDQTGGMLAALTAGLPETIGGSRNWDYRFCWLRDATFALLAMLRAGYRDEARAWIAWLHRTLAGEPIDVRPFYNVDGGRLSTEREADWLDGFCGSKPVRFGNAASGQLQLDIYGEAIDALYVAVKEGLVEDGEVMLALARQVEARWQEPDDGIWEGRGTRQHHVYSKAMCWVAFDRTSRFLEEHGAEHPGETPSHWRELADAVRADVLEKGWNVQLNAFPQTYGTLDLDAAVLRLPLVGFIAADDPRMVGTVEAIERELMHDGYVWRYKANGSDGLEGQEGSFLACSSWLVDVYLAQGRDEEAKALFERICSAANDLDLLSEEYLPSQKRMLGNFPQALSHLALINNAFGLSSDCGRVDRFQRG